MATRDSDRRRPRARPEDPDRLAAMLREAADALGLSGGAGTLTVERKRLAGRSSIYFVKSEVAVDGLHRWVLKRPHTEWTQDDLESPVTPAREFEALTRLDEHLGRGRIRVATPVAFLPGTATLLMEFVPGTTLRELLNYGSVLRPRRLWQGLHAAGEFLARVHGLEELPGRTVDLAVEAEQVLDLAAALLTPRGVRLPADVVSLLQAVPPTVVRGRTVRLHGDFGPGNILLAQDGTTVGLDAALTGVGWPEEDLVRFTVLLSGSVRFAPELWVRPLSRARRLLENRLLDSYYASGHRPPLFELLFLQQLVRRWCRLRELAEQNSRRALLPLRHKIIGAQIRLLARESAGRLEQALRR